MKKEIAYKRFLTTLPERYIEETKGDIFIHGALFTLEKNKDKNSSMKYLVTNVERIKEKIV